MNALDENEPNDGLAYEKLLEIDVIFVASNGHPALELVNPTLSDLAKYHWLFPGAGGPPFQKLRAAFKRTDTQLPEDVSTIANRQVIFSLLDEGMYLAAIPYHPSCLERNLTDLNIINVNIERISWPIHLIRREHTILSPALLAFIAQIKNIVAQST
nr:LysR substrate-binding domain-containing protein [Colwellia chukchiensis]